MDRKPIVAITLLVAIALACPGRAAQTEKESPQPEAIKLINVDFPGGSAADYVSAVRKAAVNANIAVVADLSTIKVPPMNLKCVDVGSALEVLESIPRDQPGQHAEIDVNRGDSGNPGQWQVFTVRASIAPTNRTKGQDSQVISISDLLDSQVKADDILTAVQTALEMLKSDLPPAQIRFHESTGLLIARGHPEQMDGIINVVQQLRERKERSLHQTRTSFEKTLNDCQNHLRETNGQLESMSRQATEWQTRGDLLTKELDRAREAAQTMERQNMMLRLEIESLKQRSPQGGNAKPQ